MHPLVQVEGEGIGVGHGRHSRLDGRRQSRERAECTVDVEPEALLAADVCQCVEVVDRAGVHGAGVAHDCEWLMARCPILGDRVSQRYNIDLKVVVDGNAVKSLIAQPQQLNGLLDRAVGFRRAVQDHLVGRALQSALADVESGLYVTRHRETHEVGHGAPTHQQAAGLGGIVQ